MTLHISKIYEMWNKEGGRFLTRLFTHWTISVSKSFASVPKGSKPILLCNNPFEYGESQASRCCFLFLFWRPVPSSSAMSSSSPMMSCNRKMLIEDIRGLKDLIHQAKSVKIILLKKQNTNHFFPLCIQCNRVVENIWVIPNLRK